MGFMDSIFGGMEEAPNPYAGMGAMMPGAMSRYFRQMKRQQRGAERYGRRERRRQFRMQGEGFKAEREGYRKMLDQLRRSPMVDPSIRRAHTRQLREGVRGMEMGEKSRGFYSTTRPSGMQGAMAQGLEGMMAQTYGVPRQQQMQGLRGQLAGLPARRIRARMAMREKYPGFQMSGIPLLQLQQTRAAAQPWGAMTQPLQQHAPGMFGQAFQGLLGGFSSALGGAASAGMTA